MRNLIIILLLNSFLLLYGCGKPKISLPKLTKGSPQYEFFKELSSSVPLVDPDKDLLLLETNAFKLTTGNVLLPLYQDIFNYTLGRVDKFKTEPRTKIEQFIKRGTQTIAENKLLLLEAKEAGFKADEDSIHARMLVMKKSAGGTEAFLQNLEKRHMDSLSVLQELEDNYIVEKYVHENLFAHIKVSESEIMAVYSQDKVATIRHLLMITKDKSPEEKAAIKKRMQGFQAQIKSGADFAKIAQKYSDDFGSKKHGGLIRNVNRGDLFKEIDDVIFSLPVGGVSDVIESGLGYHIIKIEDREQDPREYEQAKPKIIEQLTAPAKEKALREKIDALKTKYQMKIVANPS